MHCMRLNVYCHRVTTQLRLISISYPGIFLGDVKNARITSQDSRVVDRDFETGTIEYEVRVLDIRP
jgi:hypothetical protein